MRGGVARAAGISIALISLSRVLGLVRDMVISGTFGQNRVTDIYTAAFKLPDALFFLIAGGALSSSFIPVFTGYLATDKEEEAWKVFSVIATIMTVVVSTFVLVGEIFARQLVPLLAAPGFTSAQLDRVAHLTRIILPAQLFFFLGGLLMATLYARGHYTAPGFGPCIYNLGIISGGLFLSHALGIASLTWGGLVGAGLGSFTLQLVVARRFGITFRPSLDHHHPGVRQVWRLMLPVLLGLSLPQVDVIINQWFASFLPGGAVSALDRANRMMQIPIGIFAQAMAIAVFPTLSEMATTRDFKGYRDTLNIGLRTVLFLTIPVSVLMIVLSKAIFQLLLEHGKFTGTNSVEAAQALVFYAIGVFAWGSQAIVARGFYALRDTKTPILSGTAMTLVFIPMNYLLMKALDFRGLALATSIAAIMHSGVLLFILRRKVGGVGGRLLVDSVAKVLASSGLAAFVGYLLRGQVDSLALAGQWGPKLTGAAVLLIAGGAAVIVYVIMTQLLRVQESERAWAMVGRYLFPRRGKPLPED